ncbi:hypothetical protein TNCV_4333761 [Trichonephila clavipes]|nr:hypothetical protein TNCV_4333761 [Trichonephila clavipes]
MLLFQGTNGQDFTCVKSIPIHRVPPLLKNFKKVRISGEWISQGTPPILIPLNMWGFFGMPGNKIVFSGEHQKVGIDAL